MTDATPPSSSSSRPCIAYASAERLKSVVSSVRTRAALTERALRGEVKWRCGTHANESECDAVCQARFAENTDATRDGIAEDLQTAADIELLLSLVDAPVPAFAYPKFSLFTPTPWPQPTTIAVGIDLYDHLCELLEETMITTTQKRRTIETVKALLKEDPTLKICCIAAGRLSETLDLEAAEQRITDEEEDIQDLKNIIASLTKKPPQKSSQNAPYQSLAVMRVVPAPSEEVRAVWAEADAAVIGNR